MPASEYWATQAPPAQLMKDMRQPVSDIDTTRSGLNIDLQVPYRSYDYTIVHDGVNIQGDVHAPVHLQQIRNSFQYQDSSRQRDLLQSLNPEVTTARLAEISDSKYNTFEWVFDDSKMFNLKMEARFRERYGRDPEDKEIAFRQPPEKWSDSFMHWLRESSDIFLVSGKPGSGKSTFMKFIATHPHTKSSVEEGSGNKEAVILFHGFWAAGHELQHNSKGLLASLVYQILTCDSAAVNALEGIAQQWRKHSITQWTKRELTSLFYALLKQSSSSFCLFLDGMDEFDQNDDLDAIFDLFTEAKAISTFKVCSSCRPIGHILARFHKNPQIRLQDLTWEDIHTVVFDTLKKKSPWAGENLKDEQLQDLAMRMTKKAEGVFLWVHYVLHNVCKGLTSRDQIGDLIRRIDNLPSDMIDLYRTIWERNNRDHSVHAETTKQILSYYDLLPMPLFQLAALVLPELSEHYSHNLVPVERLRLEAIYGSFVERLPMLAGGLLECREVHSLRPGFVAMKTSSSDGSQGFWNLQVQYIHKTVVDFLCYTNDGLAIIGQPPATLQPSSARRALALLACLVEGILQFGNYSLLHLPAMFTEIEVSDLQIIDQFEILFHAVIKRDFQNISGLDEIHHDFHSIASYFLCWSGICGDFVSIVAAFSQSPGSVSYLKSTRGQLWTPYYLGYLAVCAVKSMESLISAVWITDCGADREQLYPSTESCYRACKINEKVFVSVRSLFGHLLMLVVTATFEKICFGPLLANFELLEVILKYECKHEVVSLLFCTRFASFSTRFSDETSITLCFYADKLKAAMSEVLTNVAPPDTECEEYYESAHESNLMYLCERSLQDVVIIKPGLHDTARHIYCRPSPETWESIITDIVEVLKQVRIGDIWDRESYLVKMKAQWALHPAWKHLEFIEGDPSIPDIDWNLSAIPKEDLLGSLQPVDPYMHVPHDHWREHSIYRDLYAQLAKSGRPDCVEPEERTTENCTKPIPADELERLRPNEKVLTRRQRPKPTRQLRKRAARKLKS